MRRSRVHLLLLAALVVCLALVGVLAGCGGDEDTTTTTAAGATDTTAGESTDTTAAASDEPIKLGLVADLTGPIGAIGVDVRDGMELAIDNLNAEGGVAGRQVELITEDSGTDASKGNAAFTKLIQQEQVDALVGPVWGVLLPQAAAMAERSEIPLISYAPDESLIPQEYKYLFTVVARGTILGEAVAKIAEIRGYQTVVGVSEVQNLYTTGLEVAEEESTAKGINFISVPDRFNPGDVDMSSIATKVMAEIESSDADALFIATNGLDAVTMIKALKKLGFDLPVIGTHAYGFQAFLDAGGADIEGLEFPSDPAIIGDQLPDTDPRKEILVDFGAQYEEEFGRPLSSFAAHAMTIVPMYAAAWEEVGTDKAAVREYLASLEDFVGVQGTFTYTDDPYEHTGLDLSDFVLERVENGEFLLVEPNLAEATAE